jgi:hypothetical protein
MCKILFVSYIFNVVDMFQVGLHILKLCETK